VNKTESRVELIWNIHRTICLDAFQIERFKNLLGHRLTAEGSLIISCSKHRSQHGNKEEVINRFLDLVYKSLQPVKKRRPTKPTRASQEKRVRKKKIRGEIKKQRGHRPSPE
jgi:ribosome-associated protein